jgi:hypothetical protein
LRSSFLLCRLSHVLLRGDGANTSELLPEPKTP